MYNNAEKTKKANQKLNVFQVAQKINKQQEGKQQALQILNAYRKVQDIKITNTNNKFKKTGQQKNQIRQPESEYANKIKQTLKQLNANRKKQFEQKNQIQKNKTVQITKKQTPAETHLMQSGTRKIMTILLKKYTQIMGQSFKKINIVSSKQNSQKYEIIRLWQMNRIFSFWKYQALLCKIQKQRLQKQLIEKEKKKLTLAEDFHYFISIKKFFKHWNLQTKRAKKIRQKHLQQQIMRQKIAEQEQKQKISAKINPVQVNMELQNKIRGFIDNLKSQVEGQGKQRLNTIKQKSQQSFVNVQNSHEASNEVQQVQVSDPAHDQQIESKTNQEHQELHEHQGPLTNEQLQKRRKDLEKKAKNRKQALQKLKKQKDQKKKKEQEQRILLQKQIEEEQKKIRQEQYRNFMKMKKQEQQWKTKEKILQVQATEFNRLRIMKFYGFSNWIKLKEVNKNNTIHIASLLNTILLKRKLQQFLLSVSQINQQKQQALIKKYELYYLKKLKKKVLNRLQQNKNAQRTQKQQLYARHEVNTLNIFLQQWKKARPTIQLQNYQWQRPRLKKAELFLSISLVSKAMIGFKANRDEQIQNRNIEQHKEKIKQKVHKIVEQEPTINYDQFL